MRKLSTRGDRYGSENLGSRKRPIQRAWGCFRAFGSSPSRVWPGKREGQFWKIQQHSQDFPSLPWFDCLLLDLTILEFFAETASLLQECSGGLIKVGNLTIGQADLRALEDAFKLSLRKSYGKSSSKTLPRYTRIREAVQWSKIYNKLSTTEAVATLWFSFAYQLSESMIDD